MTPSPKIMGVLNVTPDSFSDGGRFCDIDTALNQAESFLRSGADIIDVGGESTRPGSDPVSLQEEMDRVLPVVSAIKTRLPLTVSIDTRKYEVAREALHLGATIINDVSGGSDVRMGELLAAHSKVHMILMHMKGQPKDMQADPRYPKGVVTEVVNFLSERVKAFEEFGIAKERLWVDPGIGFGKTLEDNLLLIKEIDSFKGIGGEIVLGSSRKSFLARVLGSPEVSMEDRHEGTLVSNLWAWEKGATVFRVHEPAPLLRAFQTWRAIRDR